MGSFYQSQRRASRRPAQRQGVGSLCLPCTSPALSLSCALPCSPSQLRLRAEHAIVPLTLCGLGSCAALLLWPAAGAALGATAAGVTAAAPAAPAGAAAAGGSAASLVASFRTNSVLPSTSYTRSGGHLLLGSAPQPANSAAQRCGSRRPLDASEGVSPTRRRSS